MALPTLSSLLGATPSTTPRLLDPSLAALDLLTDGLDSGPLAGSGLAGMLSPADDSAADLVAVANTALEPLVGAGFAADHPNNFDPVDTLLTNVATTAKAAVGADIDALLGADSTAHLLEPLGLQADYLTDVLDAEAHALGLDGVTASLGAVDGFLSPVATVAGPLEAEALALGSTLGAPVTELLASLGGGGVATGPLLGSALAPASGRVDDAVALLGSIGFSANAGDETTGASLNGDTSAVAAPLSTATATAGALTGALLGMAPVLAAPDAAGLLAPVSALLAGLLGTAQESASTGVVDVGTAGLAAPLDTVLLSAGQLDSTGTFAPALALPAAFATLLPLPTGSAELDASGLLGLADTAQAVAAPALDTIPSISSLGGPLSGVAGLSPTSLLGALPTL